MKSEKDKIKEVFSSKLKNFEVDLPSSIWEKIDADLHIDKPLIIPINKKKKLYRYVSLVTGVAAVIFFLVLLNIKTSDEDNDASQMPQILANTSFSVSVVEQTDSNNTRVKAKQQKNQSLYAQPVAVKQLGTTTAKVKTSNTQAVAYVSSILPSIDTSAQDVLDNVATDSLSGLSSNVFVADENTEMGFDKNSSTENLTRIDDLATKILAFESEGDKNKKLLAYEPSADRSNKKSKELSTESDIEMGLGGSTGFSKANLTQVQFRESILSSMNNTGSSTSKAQKQTVHLEHNQPISVGIALNKKLTNRLSLESGLVYTYLYSKAKSASEARLKLRDSQSFHYLGIPISANFKLMEWKKFQFYLSAGGVIQKDIAGRMNTVQSINGFDESKELIKKNISQSHPQFSLTGSFGLSYPIYNKLSLYSNFGGAYYFDANNYYETIYSDRKWIFNLNLGVKFGF